VQVYATAAPADPVDRTLTPGAERLVGEEGPTPASAGRRILHVDLDAFYASVETRERPELVGLPVIVGADPKEGRGRGVVTTASYEARRFGVRSAMPISQAWRLCPQGVFVPPRFDLYHDVSERLFGILRATGAVVEAASIDEAYLDASTLAADFVEARALARRIQDAVLDAERVSASVGVASNKLVAKIATDMRKPAGVTVVPAGKEVAFLGPLPVRKIPGVGPKTEGQLRDMHVTTCGDLARTPAGVLASRFGTWGPRLAEMARGEDASPVIAEWARKSLGNESTFEEDVDDPGVLRLTVEELADGAARSLAAERLAARTVTLKLRLSDFTTFTRARTLPRATDDGPELRAAALALLDEALPEGATVRLLGVRLSHLVDASRRQKTLDLWPVDVYGEWTRPSPKTWF